MYTCKISSSHSVVLLKKVIVNFLLWPQSAGTCPVTGQQIPAEVGLSGLGEDISPTLIGKQFGGTD